MVSKEVQDLIDTGSNASIEEVIIDLAHQDDAYAINSLEQILCYRADDPYSRHWIARLAAKALVFKGVTGLEALYSALNSTASPTYSSAIIEALLYAAEGGMMPQISWIGTEGQAKLDRPIPNELAERARQLLTAFIAEIAINRDYLFKLISFMTVMQAERAIGATFVTTIFNIFAEATLKISPQLITEFEGLIQQDLPEETYQRFLSENPIFIDPLASQVILKQALGVEFVTDFVVKRLDNEYIIVEIEKPQDGIFTKNNDFTAILSHAYGQVLDFHEWIEAHAEYARTLMPQISTPRGLLIIGRRSELSPVQINKLKRFSINSKSIEIVTFDDLLLKARTLYQNIHQQRDAIVDG